MENIQLEGRTLELHYGRNVDKAPALLARWRKGEGYIPSEADIRLLGVRNFQNAPDIANNYWDTSTLSVTKDETVKVILPYETGSRALTEAARFGLGLIDSKRLREAEEELVSYGVNLDVDGRWEKLEGCGVYVMERKGLVLNQDLTEKQAMKHKLLLTKLGHPDFVDGKFARSKDEVAEIIGKTFELGKSEHGYDTMMGQYLTDVNDKGILKAWYVSGLDCRSGSNARTSLGSDGGCFAFYSSKDFTLSNKVENSERAKSFSETAKKVNAEGVDADRARVQLADRARVQLQTLEGMLKPEQIDQIGVVALNERDALRNKLLTTDQIYFAIQGYVGPTNENEVRKILDGLTKR